MRRSWAAPAPRRVAPRPAARHSPGVSPSPSSTSPSAAASPTTQTSAVPTGPNAPRAAPSTLSPSTRPAAPPSPALVGHATPLPPTPTIHGPAIPAPIGSVPSAAPSTGSASRVAPILTDARPTPRREAMRHAQASIASPGSAPASPNPCSSRSDSTAPAGPTRLVTRTDAAVFSDGSRGL